MDTDEEKDVARVSKGYKGDVGESNWGADPTGDSENRAGLAQEVR